MTPAARIAAALDILRDMDDQHRPAAEVLKDWGARHRFAGSGDRAAIATLVYDVCRVRLSSMWFMDTENERGAMLGMLKRLRGHSAEDIDTLFSGERYAPSRLTDDEFHQLQRGSLQSAPAYVLGDFPHWLESELKRSLGNDLLAEMQAMSARAPLDVRVNTLKMDREVALAALSSLGAVPTPHSPFGLRLPLLDDGRGPPVHAEPLYLQGAIEIQDEGSQLAAQLAGVKSGQKVLDLCAGAGGKTLALAALMENNGTLYASDNSALRLKPLYDRMSRAGLSLVEVRTPRRGEDCLADLEGQMDLVLVDAPCTGTGTWRRGPDTKWRMRPTSLEQRLEQQREVLDLVARYVKTGGRVVYVTCSLLRAENDDQIIDFLSRNSGFSSIKPETLALDADLARLGDYVSPDKVGLLFSPRRTGTDGFFVAALQKDV
jgi:16S rRNA (cytosine967-C5)-methyltransferase